MLLLSTVYSFQKNKRMFTLYRDKVFRVKGESFTVPRGYSFDGASVPRFLWWLFAPHGKAFESACLHDWLYDTRKSRYLTRKEVDNIFIAHMKIDQVPKVQRWLFYYAVRAFGRWKWLD